MFSLKQIIVISLILIFIALLFMPSIAIAEDELINNYNKIMVYLDSLNKTDPLPVHNYPLCFAEVLERSKLLDGVSPALIDSLLLEPKFYSRAKAAAILSKGVIVDTNTAIEILISALDNEIKIPSTFDLFLETSFSTTEFIKLQYCFGLINLIGNSGKDLLKPYVESATGELKTRLILTLGYTSDSNCRQQVRNIYPTISDGYLRFLAMDVVACTPDTLDIPTIALALNDNFSLEKNDEVSYPVRSQASGAARKLGLTVEKQGDEFKIIGYEK